MKKKNVFRKSVNIILTLLLCFSLLLSFNVTSVSAAGTASISTETPSITTCTADKNLVSNGDIESTNTGVYLDSSSNFQYWCKIATTVSHSGQKSIQLDGANWGSWSGPRFEPVINVQPNTNYTFSFWYKMAYSGSGNQFTYKYIFNSSNVVGGDHAPVIDGQWHQAAVSFNSGDQSNFKFYFLAAENNSILYIDDMFLFETDPVISGPTSTPTPTPIVTGSTGATLTDADPVNKYCVKSNNLIPNYGMELGNEYWKDQKGFSWNALSVVSDVKKNGVNSLKFTPIIDANNPISDVEFALSLEANTSYTLTFWIKATSQSSNPNAYVQMRFPYDSNKMDMLDIPVNFGSDWYLYSSTFNTGSRTNFVFNAGSSAAGVAVFFDDFYLFKTSNAIAEAPVNPDHMPYLVCAKENNMILDYNLELNNNSVWSGFSGWDFGLISKSSEVYHSGKKSLLFKGTAPTEWQSTDLKFTVTPNTDYTYSVWVNAVDGSNAILGFMLSNGTKMKWVSLQMQPDWGAGWYQVSVQFNSGTNDNAELYVGAAGSIGSGSIYLDDFYLFETKFGLAQVPSSENSNIPYEKPTTNPATGDLNSFILIIISSIAITLLLITKKKSKIILRG